MQSVGVVAALVLVLASVPGTSATAQLGGTALISVTSLGPGTAADASQIAISPDGRYVAFCTSSNIMVPADPTTFQDVYLRDRVTQQTALVSVGITGFAANALSGSPSISGDGRYVSFSSSATDIVPGDLGGQGEIFVRDMLLGQTVRVSVAADGGEANGESIESSISADGRYVAFESLASNLVPSDTNGVKDVFVRDLVAGTTVRASVGSDGTQANKACSDPSISLDGTRVAFQSPAGTLVHGDTNATDDVFVHDLASGLTVRASVASNGAQAAQGGAVPALSGDGRIVGFHSWDPALVPGDTNDTADVFVHDLDTGLTERVNVGLGGAQANFSSFPDSAFYDERWVSADGRCVAFATKSWTLVPGDVNSRVDVFVHDRLSGLTEIVSKADDGSPSDGDSQDISMSADGRVVAFGSVSEGLVTPPPPLTATTPYAYARDRGAWTGLGSALAGSAGLPDLFAQGSLEAGEPGSLLLRLAKPNAPAALLIASPGTPVPVKGGTLWAFPALLLLSGTTSPDGQILLAFTWPAGVPTGLVLRLQYVIQDGAAVAGFALSDAVEALVP